MVELKKTLNFYHAAAIGIGAIIGAGIFVVSSIAVGYAGPAVVISIIVEGTAALFTAISSAELHTYLDPNIHGTLKPRRGGSLAYLEEKTRASAEI